MKEQNIYYCETGDTCKDYSCGRIIAFLSSLLSYLKNPSTEKKEVNAKIYTMMNNLIEIDLTFKDKISNKYLLTKSKNKNIAINISQISEIYFNDDIYINHPKDDTLKKKGIILQIPDISPPEICFDIKMTKELLSKSFNEKKPLRFIKLLNITLLNKFITSISEGIMTVSGSNGGAILIPFRSIVAISGDYLHG